MGTRSNLSNRKENKKFEKIVKEVIVGGGKGVLHGHILK